MSRRCWETRWAGNRKQRLVGVRQLGVRFHCSPLRGEVPPGHVWLFLGYMQESFDSQYFGPIKRSAMIGTCDYSTILPNGTPTARKRSVDRLPDQTPASRYRCRYSVGTDTFSFFATSAIVLLWFRNITRAIARSSSLSARGRP